ncbi:MAG TPA: crossover junction endodeoxyribonuclease RuvC [bacterium]|nr:crossover junction endodeoxyribonuclease RuvC [bacterium]HQG14185.1 crossover junction endodeoxyribonuclease RuvC [bacterium]HQH80004.1 crossover junction endodeoxyribonuclease RuvC [bacterium]
MRVLGIDPGSRTTGYGIVEISQGKVHHVDNGGISPSPSLPFAERLKQIYQGLQKLIEDHRPDAVAIENIFVAKNVKSSLILGHARGTAMLAASIAGVEVTEYSPREVKQAVVGTGNATKDQIQRMVKVMLSLPEVAFEDASDALAVAICHCNAESYNSKLKSALKKGTVKR